MNTQAIAKQASMLLKKSGDFLHTNSPAIFAGIAIAGVISTTVMAVRATLKAADDIEEACYTDPDNGEYIEPDAKEKIQLVWKHYVPVVLMAGLTVGAVVTSHTIQSKRNAILAGLLTTSQKALEDYQTKTEEVVGKSKAEKIKDAVAEERIARLNVDEEKIIQTGYGHTLCYDWWSGRLFESDIEKIRQAMNDFNFQLNNDFSMSMNELYGMMNLDTAGCGEEVGFTTACPLEFEFRSMLTSSGRPCLVVDYKHKPMPTFRDW